MNDLKSVIQKTSEFFWQILRGFMGSSGITNNAIFLVQNQATFVIFCCDFFVYFKNLDGQ